MINSTIKNIILITIFMINFPFFSKINTFAYAFDNQQWREKIVQLENNIKEFYQACPNNTCNSPYSIHEIYTLDQINRPNLPTNFLSRFQFVAKKLTLGWEDTILESTYVVQGPLKIEAIYGLFRGRKLLAYQFFYSKKAWNTASCDYDGSSTSLQDCEEGQISEGAFLFPDGRVYMNDENYYAEFN